MEHFLQTRPPRSAPANSDSRNNGVFDPIQLLEVTAHDLRNPISGILAAGQYLLEDANSVLDEHHLALLQSIDASSRSMLRLIEDALELCGIESGHLRLAIETTDLQPVMNRALLLSNMVADLKQIRLEVEHRRSAPLPAICVDPVRILHALDSLLLTSIKLARRGSKISIGAGSRGDRLTVWVRTEGFGISPVALRSLFNPFRKGRNNRPGVEGGIALSLAKVGRIIEAHGGAVRVEGREGAELLIKLALPLTTRSAARKGAAGAH
uniref:histidine kinase n=1 Tax=Solibacter usitatus (strain Ellin6076) TaxID=234267 RepID=Q01YP4_SOLUE